MKRLAIVVAVTALTALLAGGGQAQAAAPADPIKALRKQFAAGRGVLVSETTRSTVTGIKGDYRTRTVGMIGFGESRAVSYDLTSRLIITSEIKAKYSEEEQEYLRAPLRAIKVGRYTYVSGFEWGEMPPRVSWVRFGKANTWWGNEGQRGDQLVDVLDPAILRLVMSKATSPKPGEYRGTLTAKELYKDGYVFSDVAQMSFRLFVNRDQLPVRLITEHSQKTYIPNQDGEWVKATQHDVVDTRYNDWGVKVKITAPPENEVVDFIDLPGPFAPPNPHGGSLTFLVDRVTRASEHGAPTRP
ncbi:hypothetical protein N5079_25715 [Planotetraspora sp. A-T 1434]|uniref:hypothetical protein n=1 Tax=Planotetraspora sp. A-T 1434 TaxID=2979219 RepID=UPI0021C1B42F|nr:hypothetical protein [Planotetraspora sp. A-T 1434]MCT9933617.1 hypothetical protein [Planotetraspora sp. A-T 1434]